MKNHKKRLSVFLALSVLLSFMTFVSCGGDGGGSGSPSSPTSPEERFRFTDNGDGTITDNSSRLIWLKNANCAGKENWWDALAWARQVSSGTCGLSDGSVVGDWHLPTIYEFYTLVDYTRWNPALPPGHPFVNVQYQLDAYVFYWSATEVSANYALFIDMASGGDDSIEKYQAYYMWPVRGGQ